MRPNTRECLYNGIKVYFHRFTDEPYQESSGFDNQWQWVSYPMAIVEFEDGHVETVAAMSIQFIVEE
jgi:hypothetical protein